MSKKTLITVATIFMTFSCLAGCDKREDIVLDEAEIEGPLTIKIVQEVLSYNPDAYTLEVYDNKKVLRAILRTSKGLPEGTMILHDDGKTWMMKNGKMGYILPQQIFSDKQGSLN